MSEQAGHLNAYTCTSCSGRITTINADAGTTPMFLNCRAKRGCPGTMQSHGYRVDQSAKPSHEWYRPTLREAKRYGAGMVDHVARGGLDLRPVGERA